MAGLGMARTVWGGPPAEDQPTDTAASETVDPVDAAAVEGAALPAIDETEPAGLPAETLSAPPASAGSLRSQMESGMAEIGELAVEARSDDDLVRATCVLDKQDRANDVMDLGTSEMLIIRDVNTSDQARGFALEKLEAASMRIDKLVEEAKACSGQQGPEDQVDITRNDSEESPVIFQDPSAGLGNHPPIPPPLDGGWPPAASPVE
ncbi:MAG: hypothetical protein KC431_27380 [Myxococcales bacterium]|nr:hypothetical protein [Myxococcales bacterium]